MDRDRGGGGALRGIWIGTRGGHERHMDRDRGGEGA